MILKIRVSPVYSTDWKLFKNVLSLIITFSLIIMMHNKFYEILSQNLSEVSENICLPKKIIQGEIMFIARKTTMSLIQWITQNSPKQKIPQNEKTNTTTFQRKIPLT